MDISETYKKMCRQAERVAPELFYKDVFDVHDYAFLVEGNDLLWWLPRQGQLQEMLLTPLVDIFTLNYNFYNFIFKQGEFIVTECASQFGSMEQLWLAFVMKEKYNKIWDGEEWKQSKE